MCSSQNFGSKFLDFNPVAMKEDNILHYNSGQGSISETRIDGIVKERTQGRSNIAAGLHPVPDSAGQKSRPFLNVG